MDKYVFVQGQGYGSSLTPPPRNSTHTHDTQHTGRQRERETESIYRDRSFLYYLDYYYSIIFYLFFAKISFSAFTSCTGRPFPLTPPSALDVAFHRERRVTSKVSLASDIPMPITSSGCAEALQDGTARSRNGGCTNSPIMFVVVGFCTLMKVVKMPAAMQRSTAGQHRPIAW